jgi:hypothetical protein
MGAKGYNFVQTNLFRASRLEHDFIQYFTSIIKGDTFEEVYEKVKIAIKTHSKSTIWVPANEMF